MPLLPDCEDCGQPRDTRSPRCAKCRRKHRTELQNASQRRRRAARKPAVIRPAELQRIAATATFAAQAADALAEWLARPRQPRPESGTRHSPEEVAGATPRLGGGDYARAVVVAIRDLLEEMRRSGLA